LLPPLRRCQAGERANAIRLAVALALAAACVADDTVVPVETPPSPLQGALRHITFNSGPDVSPTWMPGGSQLVYAARGLPPAPEGVWRRYRIAATGGRAEEEAAYRATAGLEPLPFARAPDGRLAAVTFLETVSVDCPCVAPWPAVRALTVAVADLTQPAGSVEDLPSVRVDLGSWRRIDSLGTPLYDLVVTAMQARRIDDYAAVFGPSWSPDGERLALSDGDRLLVWTPASGTLDTIPGVRDAAFPRWSPDGSALAYTFYPASAAAFSVCAEPPGAEEPLCYARLNRTVTPSPEVWMVRPDGTGRSRLTQGEEASWLPGGSSLIVRRSTGLFLVNAAAGAVTPIPNTSGASEPAVSPDGRRVAFVSRASGNLDLWTVELPSP
jgi:hypothetical protein